VWSDKATSVARSGARLASSLDCKSSPNIGGLKLAPCELVICTSQFSTAYYSTGIKNIEVRMAVTPPLRIAMSLPGFARKIFGMPFVQSFLKAQIARMPEGPSDEVLRTGRRVLVGVVTNTNGENARARVTTGQGNVLTAQAGVEIARRVIAGEVKVRFQTPSLVYGSDFILQFEGATREELK
jgi:short subunit dehydrogenase-like uncharacterized protein